MDPAVPLVIPEVNADHLGLITRQRRERGWTGAIVTNPNCSTVVIAMVLAPLRQFGLRSLMVTTLQAVSGAGYPGVPSLDILGNVIPAISGEEEKIESETQKILGTYAEDAVVDAPSGRQRDHDPRAGDRRAHRVDLDRARREAVARRGACGVAVVPGQATGARAAHGAGAAHRRLRRARPAAAARSTSARAAA